MKKIQIIERELTSAELAREHAGFDENGLENGNPQESSVRYTFVAMDGTDFIGCSSGLAYKNGDVYNGWFNLTDLYVEKPYRGQGLGATLLRKLEERIARIGVTKISTFTAGFEAPGFYKKQGYHVIYEQEDWYATGHSRIALRKG